LLLLCDDGLSAAYSHHRDEWTCARGAKVRLLLDSFFDDGEDLRSNRATVEYVNTIAAAGGLDMQARTGNSTGGIHMKLVLVQVNGETWSAMGSLNGGEISYKVNREVVARAPLI
jgi:hypothetical protein